MKDRKRFDYASDILSRHRVPMDSNDVLRDIIHRNEYYDNLPINESTELMKGNLLTDQAALVAEYDDQDLLCEVLDNQGCRLNQCPMFVAVDAQEPMVNRHGQPLCGEFRLVFERKQAPDTK